MAHRAKSAEHMAEHHALPLERRGERSFGGDAVSRSSEPKAKWLPVAYLTMRPYLREAGSDQANYMAV